jgi:hypothetical protein
MLLVASPPYRVEGYMPVVGHQTHYEYGFISTQANLSAFEIETWTAGELVLPESNYTMHWHQHVNLTISVVAISLTNASYEFNVTIHSNVVTVSNSSPWQTAVVLNGSANAPDPTGVIPGILDYTFNRGLPGFFLDDTTLASISLGNDVLIGDSLWDTITNTTYVLGENTESCYHLQNTSITSTAYLETQYVIDQDVGIYFSANETQILTYDSDVQSLTYYFRVLSTTIPLIPPPDLTLLFIVIGVIIIIVVIIIYLSWRYISRRRRRVRLPPAP